MSELSSPRGWAWTSLGELRLDARTSVNPASSPTQSFELYSVPSYDTGRPEVVQGAEVGSSKQTVEKNSVLLCKINPRINRVWIVGDFTRHPKIASTEWIPFPPLEGVAPEYLRYFMNQHAFRDFLAGNVSGVGGSLMRVRPGTLADYAVPLPPMSEQRRIVTKIEELFSQLDAGVEELKKAKAQLKRYRQSVLKAAFEGKLTEEWRKQNLTTKTQRHKEGKKPETARELLARIREERKKALGSKYKDPPPLDTSELPELPTGWTWTTAEQLCAFITKGTTPRADKLTSVSGEVPFLKVYNLTFDGSLDFSIKPTFVTRKTHEGELARSKVYPGDVLMNIVGPPLGKVSIVTRRYPEWNVNQAIAIFRPLPGYSLRLLSYCLQTGEVLQRAMKKAKTTAGQSNLTLEICRELPLPIPPEAEQGGIVAEIERRLSVADAEEKAIEAALRQAARLRQSILKRAFEGRLVPQDPSDEPAERLLERIRAEKAKREAGQSRRRGRRTAAARK
jgi:type I restriction enzyme S subunit